MIHEGAIMPHSQIMINKKASNLNLAPKLRLANQTEKLLRYCPMRRFDIERGAIRLSSTLALGAACGASSINGRDAEGVGLGVGWGDPEGARFLSRLAWEGAAGRESPFLTLFDGALLPREGAGSGRCVGIGWVGWENPPGRTAGMPIVF